MNTSTSQKAKIGIFTIVGLVVLVIGIFVIGNKKNMFGDTFSIYGTFKNVGGLQIGNNVRFAGINVGTVEGIVIVNDTTVRVDMRMQKRVQQFLKSDAIASIGSDGLMGDKLITIAPGLTGDKMIEKNGQIPTVNPVDYDKIITRVTHVVDNAEAITNSLASIVGEISSGRGNLGKLIYTDDLQKGLVSTVASAKATMQSAKEGVEGFSQNMDAVKHNFLLKGYFKKKAKAKADSINAAKAPAADGTQPAPPESRRQKRKEAKEAKKAAKEGQPATDVNAK